jgi:hypothetical protein
MVRPCPHQPSGSEDQSQLTRVQHADKGLVGLIARLALLSLPYLS